MNFNLISYLFRQKEFSERNFGPGTRLKGVLNHIRKELVEVEANPSDLSEWCDIMILAMDGALRQGFAPEAISEALEAKFQKNNSRDWPDWRTMSQDEAIEHIKSANPQGVGTLSFAQPPAFVPPPVSAGVVFVETFSESGVSKIGMAAKETFKSSRPK